MPNPTLPTPDPKDVAENKGVAAVGYISILFLVPLFLKPQSPYAKFHGKQGMILFILELFGFIPLLGWMLWVLAVVAAVYGFLEAWNGRATRIPVIADLADRIKF